MTIIDPSTNLGRLRLRCADFGDIVYLPDSVYLQTLVDTNNNLPQAAKICASYILGMLSFKTHRKIGLQLEVWGSEAFTAYKQYLLLITTNPAFMDISPIPWGASGTDINPIIQFQQDWNKNFYRGSESQQLTWTASISPNDGTLLGPFGTSTVAGNGWEITPP